MPHDSRQHVVGVDLDFSNAPTGEMSGSLLTSDEVPASHMGVYGGVIGLPWALKPVIGVMSDCFPIFGYAKVPALRSSQFLM